MFVDTTQLYNSLTLYSHRLLLFMFLFESVTLTLIGGALGVLFGIAISYIISHVAHWHFYFFVLPPVVGFIVSVLVGIFFGYYPALD